jgi:hypothetical protein
MRIQGSCHCGNVSYVLEWPGEAPAIPVRGCGCTFCSRHGARWTSHPDAKLAAVIADRARLSRYRFGTSTADFHVCAACGVAPFVTSSIEGRIHAVVNVNTFDGVDARTLTAVATHFAGESVGERLARRARGWIADVTIGGV